MVVLLGKYKNFTVSCATITTLNHTNDFFVDAWMKKLEEYGPWFKAQEDLKADESKRPGKPTNYDDLFGIDGSFRQLAID